tara:strand:- start:191 stop:952 length:762 start_codon:yes stop_codon:yes gene_type:complete
MKSTNRMIPRYFSDTPTAHYICPNCKEGKLVPLKESFKLEEPKNSKEAHGLEEWDPDWIDYRFIFKSVCDNVACGEVSFATGSGSVDQRYNSEYEAEYYERFQIRSFYPAPYLIAIPEDTPLEVRELVEKSFTLFWPDLGAASNALRASLEVLLDQLKLPRTKVDKKNMEQRLSLHRRLELWGEKEKEHADLCLALKEVGNLGSHGDDVHPKHYAGVLKIFSHVLFQLFENNAEEMKKLAASIQKDIKAKKNL